ncbi:MAG TPA: DMT family transporter [Alphaproteobacteria bacterium]|nr:DMT family transporter [Alphaproteobacteria bacterium]
MALAFLLLLGLIWGLSNMLTKLALEGIDTFAFTFWQATLAFGILAALAAIRKLRPPMDRQHLRYYVVNGLLGLALPGLNIAIVVQHIPAGLLSAIVSTAALFTYMLALAIGQERYHPLRALGVLIGLAGALLILLPRTSLPSSDMAQWVLLALLTPFLYGVNGVFAGRFMPKGTDAAVMASGLLATTGILYLLLMVSMGEATVPWPPVWPSTYAMYALALGASIAYVVYFRLIRLAGSVYMSQVGYLVVAVGVVAGMIVFDERHSVWVWAGMVLMVVGVTLVNLGQQKRAQERSAVSWWAGST